MSLTKAQIESGNAALNTLLSGAQLDSFQAYSTWLAIGFVGGATASAWISTNQKLAAGSTPLRDFGLGDFRNSRREVLGELYDLVGQRVVSAKIGDAAELVIEFDNQAELIVILDDEEDEVLWSVTSDTPSAFVPHDWAVLLLTRKSDLVVKTPSGE